MANVISPPTELWTQYYPESLLPQQWELLNKGLIHQTWKFMATSHAEVPGAGIFQKVNTQIFARPEILYANYSHLLEAADIFPFEIPKWLLTLEGKPFALDTNGGLWRQFSFVHGFPGSEQLTPEQMVTHAAALGKLHVFLSTLDTEQFEAAIPEFLRLEKRIEAYAHAISMASPTRLKKATKLINAISEVKKNVEPLVQKLDNGIFPLRIIHGDPKSTNLIFDPTQKNIIAFLDWDTLMPGSFLYDFGDMVRSLCSELARVEPAFMKNIEQAYLAQASPVLTEEEIIHLTNAPFVVMWVQTLRFLTDYLMGDPYYTIEYKDHNLDRATIQFKQMSNLYSI
jgi:Ser/Thr protein kinase RdoA (MazF antagonist)